MAWDLKTKNAEAAAALKDKNAEAASTIKDKIEQEGDTLYILTPDLDFIMVGMSEDLNLIWQEAFNNWGLKVKIEP